MTKQRTLARFLLGLATVGLVMSVSTGTAQGATAWSSADHSTDSSVIKPEQMSGTGTDSSVIKPEQM